MPQFITLTEVYQKLISQNAEIENDSRLVNEAAEGVVRLRNTGMVDVFITESDIKNSPNFDQVMQIQNPAEQKTAIEDLILEIMRERVEKCDSMCGVRINMPFSYNDVIPYRFSIAKLINDYAASRSENSDSEEELAL